MEKSYVTGQAALPAVWQKVERKMHLIAQQPVGRDPKIVNIAEKVVRKCFAAQLFLLHYAAGADRLLPVS